MPDDEFPESAPKCYFYNGFFISGLLNRVCESLVLRFLLQRFSVRHFDSVFGDTPG